MWDHGRTAAAICLLWLAAVAGMCAYYGLWRLPRLEKIDPVDVALESGAIAILSMALISSIVLYRLGAGEVFPAWSVLPLISGVVLSGLLCDFLDEFYELPWVLMGPVQIVPPIMGTFLLVHLMKGWYEMYPERPRARWDVRLVLAFYSLYGSALVASIATSSPPAPPPLTPGEVVVSSEPLLFAVLLAGGLCLSSGGASRYVPIQLVLGGFLLLVLLPLTETMRDLLGWMDPLVDTLGRDVAPAVFYASFYMAFVEAFRRAACPQALRVPRVYEAVSLMKIRPRADSWPSAVSAIRKLSESKGIPVVLLTRPGSPLFTIAHKDDLPKVYVLLRPGASFRKIDESTYEVPLEPAFIEGVLRDILRGQEKRALVVFDSITDAIALLDRKRAYELIRRLSDLIKEKKSSGVFIVVPEAHDEQTRALIEKMFERSSEV
ncbi:MAG: hypothetical protein QI223_08680 [Candidatus Korarchaeota archaeon]|nr:hypothetical protein [Candidatus Korarchaeota archaeon]